jgi:hypothetical protein
MALGARGVKQRPDIVWPKHEQRISREARRRGGFLGLGDSEPRRNRPASPRAIDFLFGLPEQKMRFLLALPVSPPPCYLALALG